MNNESLYRKWLLEVIENLPQEPRSKCSNCDTINFLPTKKTSRDRFHPQLKCCSFVPNLPNFNIGNIFLDSSNNLDNGRQVIQKIIQNQKGVSPLCINISSLLGSFCPYFENSSGSCIIWPYRNGQCATWYCKMSRGVRSQAFWQALENLIFEIEKSLSLACLIHIGVSDSVVSENLITRKNNDFSTIEKNEIDEEQYHKIWGRWIGKEKEFYTECAHFVAPLVWDDIANLGGIAVTSAAQVARKALSQLNSCSIPYRLNMSDFNVVGANERSYHVVTYSPYDPLEIPNSLFSLLFYFDGSESEKIFEKIERESEFDFDHNLLVKLVDFDVLHGVAQPNREPGRHLTNTTILEDTHSSPELVFGHINDHFDYHIRMLVDDGRIDAYAKAIESLVKPGQHVVEVGTGTGILALLAARAGAQVTAIEALPIIEMARQIAAKNGLLDKIQFVRGHSPDVSIDFPGDVLISEIIGNQILDESVLEYTIDARKRFVTPNALLIPNSIEIIAEVGYSSRFDQFKAQLNQLESKSKLSFEPVINWLDHRIRTSKIFFELGPKEKDFIPLTQPVVINSIDLHSLERPDFIKQSNTRVCTKGIANAVLLSFRLKLAPHIELFIGGKIHSFHWNRPVYMVSNPQELNIGDNVIIKLRYSLYDRIYASIDGLCD